MFGKKKRNQNCLLLTEDGRILDISLPADKGYVVSEKTGEAWGLNPDSCIPERGTNKLFLVMTERDCVPMSLNGKGQQGGKRDEDMISKIAQEHASEARANVQKKPQKSKFFDTLQWLLLIFAITIAVLVVFGLFASGKLNLPNFGGGGSIFG